MLKRILPLLLVAVLLVGLVACGETPAPVDTEGSATNPVSSSTADKTSDGSSDESSDEAEAWAPGTEPNLVLAVDQWNKRLVVYDMSLVGEEGNLDQAEVWTYEGESCAGLKYREDTVYGDVVIFGGGRMISYETKESLWTAGAGKAGSNPHSIEILPSGNIVTASSTDGRVTIFNTYAELKEGAVAKATAYDLPGAHGVLWDPEYQLLWAVGDYDLVAYQVKVENGNEVLRQVSGIGGKLPTTGGHDLAADLTDTGYLYLTTVSGVYRFDKEANEFSNKFNQHAKINKKNVKGIGNNKNGNFFFCIPNQGVSGDREWKDNVIADWCTDTIYYAYWKSENFLYVQECVSEKSAYYKVRVFYGQYQ